MKHNMNRTPVEMPEMERAVLRTTNYIHPTAIIYKGVEIGDGNYIGPYCVIGSPPEYRGHFDNYGKVIIGNNNRIEKFVTIDSGSLSNTTIGFDNLILVRAHIGHDVTIKSRCTIGYEAGIGGFAYIEDDVNLAMRCTIHPKKYIPKKTYFGMGSLILDSSELKMATTYVGHPVRELGPNKKWL